MADEHGGLLRLNNPEFRQKVSSLLIQKYWELPNSSRCFDMIT